MFKTILNKINIDWVDIKNKCRTTVGKDGTDNVPSSKFKLDLLISEHSPIRLGHINFSWKGIKSWCATHWSRHKFECFIETRRSDRTGIDRGKLSQDELVNFDGDINMQSNIDVYRKRLCFQSSNETRELAEDFKMAIKDKEPELYQVLVPNCIYRLGCPEFQMCSQKILPKFLIHCNGKVEDLLHIERRYKMYNEMFEKDWNDSSE